MAKNRQANEEIYVNRQKNARRQVEQKQEHEQKERRVSEDVGDQDQGRNAEAGEIGDRVRGERDCSAGSGRSPSKAVRYRQHSITLLLYGHFRVISVSYSILLNIHIYSYGISKNWSLLIDPPLKKEGKILHNQLHHVRSHPHPHPSLTPQSRPPQPQLQQRLTPARHARKNRCKKYRGRR